MFDLSAGWAATCAAVALCSAALTSTANAQDLEVQVRGARSETQRLDRSAEAVSVIETRVVKQQAADLGEVLARSPGIAVQREGGLGSNTRFGLNGLYDDQIRIFVDGVPLAEAGLASGLADVPLSLLERIEVYRGVVPLRFGADALGGAVNLVTDLRQRQHLNASYQLGSFGTQRATATGRFVNESSGLSLGISSFVDVAKNNYKNTVEVPDETGRVTTQTLTRQHDGYQAYGGNLELGVIDKPWARRLLIRGFGSLQNKEYQSNQTMTAPYGELRSSNSVWGATLLHEVSLGRHLELNALANFAHNTSNFSDTADWVYGWSGERIRPRMRGGETDTTRKRDTTIWQDSVRARVVMQWKPTAEHALRIAISPSYAGRTGDERVQAMARTRDPASARRSLLTVVSGVEYELDILSDRLSNIAFVKDYIYNVNSQEPPLMFLDPWTTRKVDTHRLGIGDALLFRIAGWLDAKASYEYTTRLPTAEELFGDGDFRVLANAALLPEVSHNGNVGLRARTPNTALGKLALDINAFVRDTDRLIMLDVSANQRTSQYKNVTSARGLGLDNSVTWTAPGGAASLDGMLSWQSVRNSSTEGDYGAYEGNRIPNQPYFFAGWGGSLLFRELLTRQDQLSPYYHGRFVHSFYRSWESLGRPEWKLSVPDQITHSIGITWSFTNEVTYTTLSLELDNLTDTKVFDVYGAQRPGRAFYLKLTGELR